MMNKNCKISLQQLKFILALAMSFIALKTFAQPEPIVTANLKNLEVKSKEIRKAQNALGKCGLSFAYDTANQNLFLKIHDPLYLPKIFNHKQDMIELQIEDLSVFLSGKMIREQLKANYLNKKLPKMIEAFDQVIKRHKPSFISKHTIYHDHKELFQDYKAGLTDLALNGNELAAIAMEFKKQYKTFKKDYRLFNKFLKNKYHSNYLVKKDEGPWSISFENVDNQDFSINFYKRNQKITRLRFDTLFASPADFLPQYEIADCEPYNRYTYFKKIKGMGLQQYNFKPYQPLQWLEQYMDFTLLFAQNESKCSSKDIEDILTLLNDSSYIIRKAKIHAYASVEGDDAINLRLQKERAQLLLDLLQEHNRDSIKIVEFHTNENWEKFYQQVKDTKYQSWAELSKQAIKSLLAVESNASDWKDSLAVQRKAVLMLQLYKQADTTQQIMHAINDYKKLVKQYIAFSNRLPDNKSESTLLPYKLKILAVEDFLKQMVRAGNLSTEKFNQLQSISAPFIDIVRFYSMMLDEEKNLGNVYTNQEEIIAKAYDAVISTLYNTNYNKYRQQYWQRQAIDIQMYAFDQINAQKISAQVICKFAWPDKSVFYPLILNELDYVNKKSTSFISNLSCYKVDSTDTDDKEFIEKENVHAVSFNPPLDYRLPHSDYYFYLKKRLLQNDQDILKMAVRSDNHLEFDLYELLWYSIVNWDVWNNRYYDDEVDYRKMLKLMDKLMAENGILCRTQLYQLYMALHLKVSYLARHKPDDHVSKQVFYSLKKLHNYYLNNLALVKQENAIKLADHLIWMGKYFHNNETIDMARILLSKLDQQSTLSVVDQKSYNSLPEAK